MLSNKLSTDGIKTEKNKKVIAIFLDFKRAFQTIDIQGIELKGFESYLTNKRQVTKINNVISPTANNDEYGVPQGPILAALLFVIYINNKPNLLNDCEIILYADDALIYIEADTMEQCYDILKTDIDNVNRWLKINKLKLNESKTEIMEIKTKSDIHFEFNDKEIEKVNQIKYLGFIMDNNLNLKGHIDFREKIGFLRD